MPTSVTALLIIMLAAAPGYAYLRCVESRLPRDTVSTTREIVEIISVGFLGSAVSALVLLSVGETSSAFLPLRALTSGSGYLRAHPWQLILSGLCQVILAVALSAAVGLTLGRRSSEALVREGNLWNRLLTRTRAGRRPYIAIELENGRLIEGYLLAVSNHPDSQDREIALQAPLAETWPGKSRQRSAAAFVIINGAQIHTVSVAFPEPRRRTTASPLPAEAPRTRSDPSRHQNATLHPPSDCVV